MRWLWLPASPTRLPARYPSRTGSKGCADQPYSPACDIATAPPDTAPPVTTPAAAITVVPPAMPAPPALNAPPPSAANEAFVSAAPPSEEIAVPVLALPSKPAAPAEAAIGPAAASAAPPVATAATATIAVSTGCSVTVSTTLSIPPHTPSITTTFTAVSMARPVPSTASLITPPIGQRTSSQNRSHSPIVYILFIGSCRQIAAPASQHLYAAMPAGVYRLSSMS